MKTTLILAFAFLLSVTSFADLKKIQGTWKASSGQIGGKDLPKTLLDKMVLIIKDNTYDYDEGHGHDLGNLKETKGQLTWMDIVGTSGPNKGKTYLTIFRLDGKMLTIYYGLDGKRPKSFDDPGKTVMVMKYERAKN